MPDEASVVTYPEKRVVVRTFDFSDADATVSLSAVPMDDIQSASTLSAAGTINLDVDSR